jgi:hypothetical protein
MSATPTPSAWKDLETKILADLGIADPYAEDAHTGDAEVMP